MEDGGCLCSATVLIVEDEYYNLYPITSKFDQKKLVYDIAGNGKIAVGLFIKNYEKQCCNIRYKIVFTDMNMP